MKLQDKHEDIYTDHFVTDDYDELLVHIPVETLFYAMNHREFNPLKVLDRNKMVDYVVEWLTEWGGDAEIGSTAFEDFLDRMFDDALEIGEMWLDFDEDEL
jgi:hypothetical protein